MISCCSHTRLFLIFLLGVTGLRLLWHLFLNPVGITGDEAYNWEWGRNFAWGYYSKPPGSAWLHGFIGTLSNDSLFAIKATATLLAAGSSLFLFLALRHLFQERFAYGVALIYLLSPGQWVVASILTADAQLLFYWNLSLLALVRIFFPKEENSPLKRDFLLLFFALALGHLAKQMMLVQIPLLLLAAAFIRPRLFRHPLFYLAPLASLASLLPALLWNAQHDWVTLTHTAHHFEKDDFSLSDLGERFGALLALSALLLTPLAVAAIPRSLKHWWQKKRATDPHTLFLILYGSLPFAIMFLLTLRQDVNPNWPAAYHGGTLALAGVCYAFQEGEVSKAWRVTLRMTVALTLLVITLFTFAEFFFKIVGPARAQRRTSWGYPELALQIADHDPEQEHALILVGHRDGASQLAFNLPNKPAVAVWNEEKKIAHQYDFWPGPELGHTTLLIIERRREENDGQPTDRMKESFEHIEYLAEYDLHPSREFPKFRVYRTSPLLSWPSPLAKNEKKKE